MPFACLRPLAALSIADSRTKRDHALCGCLSVIATCRGILASLLTRLFGHFCDE